MAEGNSPSYPHSRRERCHYCGKSYELPPPGQPEPEYQRRPSLEKFCTELCSFHEKLKQRGVPLRYRTLTLESFNAYTSSLERKLEIVKQWATSDLRTGLFLFGSVGSGKTHLAVGAMRALIRRRIQGDFVKCRQFIFLCQSAFSKGETVADLADRLLCWPSRFLVLDDLGSAKATDFVRQSLLHLVDEAYTQSKTLIVTSNLNLDQVHNLDPRMASRLAEMCELLRFDEPDYRIRLAPQRTETNLAQPATEAL